jgi:protein-tyrosine-phosphatase
MVDALARGDLTFQELAASASLPGNLAAHHLDVLESAGLIERHRSEGDSRRRYISLRADRLAEAVRPVAGPRPRSILFVCTHNSARSQFAAALWRRTGGSEADSAGTEPADHVDPRAVRVAAEYGLDLATAVPKAYRDVSVVPELVVSVCDRARESAIDIETPTVHWSVPDPVRVGTIAAFRDAFRTIAARIDRLAAHPH